MATIIHCRRDEVGNRTLAPRGERGAQAFERYVVRYAHVEALHKILNSAVVAVAAAAAAAAAESANSIKAHN